MTTESRPVDRRLLLTLGAAALLGGCATPARGALRSRWATPSPASSPTPPPWPVPTPSPPTAGVCPTAPGIVNKPGGPEHYLPCTGTDIALTIDDGPDPQWTPQVLALLARYHIHATFCMIGRSVKAHPNLVAAVNGAGHQIANHTFDHPTPLGRLAPERIRAEIGQTSDAIVAATGGQHPKLFRAPGGEWSPTILATCTSAGMRPLDWSVDPRDWSLPGTQHIVEVILTKTRPGSIILDHDGDGGGSASRQQTVEALSIALPRLLEAGYHFTMP